MPAVWLGIALACAWAATPGAAWAQEPDAALEAPAPGVRVSVELRQGGSPDLPEGLVRDVIGADVAAAPPASEWMGAQVEAVEEMLREARFRSAMGISEQLRSRPAATRDQRVRLELVHATAALALGEDAVSQQSFGRLLAIDPGFELDDTHSPKLRRALERARAANP